jgi:N-acyl-D-amino-acid deacylase
VLDVKITGGTVVDGTGADRFLADIGINDGRIVEVRRRDGGAAGIDGEAATAIDATGRVVTPGFVDIHTHYDGQVSWDETLEPSSLHGVTTVVSGNCGVGFAPVRPGEEQWLIQLMEGVEDIPGSALAEGITWEWESFPEYLDAIEKRHLAVDFGTQIAHGAVRGYAMGERGARNEEADEQDVAAMARTVREAVEAGALGFSTSRTEGHRAVDGEPVPGTYAAERELVGLGRAMAAGGQAVFEVAPAGAVGEGGEAPILELDWMARMAREIERPVSFAMVQTAGAPDLWRKQLDLAGNAVDKGIPVYAQIAARPFGMLFGVPGYHAFARPV